MITFLQEMWGKFLTEGKSETEGKKADKSWLIALRIKSHAGIISPLSPDDRNLEKAREKDSKAFGTERSLIMVQLNCKQQQQNARHSTGEEISLFRVQMKSEMPNARCVVANAGKERQKKEDNETHNSIGN